MGKKYENPPIIEALCDFRFEKTEWNAISPSKIFEAIKKDYPDIKQINFHALQPDGKLLIESRTQFVKKNKEGIVQFTNQLLSVHILKKYSSWKEFFPEIKKMFHLYSSITNPNKIKRIGLRYVNKINIGESFLDLQRKLKLFPYIGKSFSNCKEFEFGTTLGYEDDRDFLNLTQRTVPVVKDVGKSIILDLNYYSDKFKENEGSDTFFNWIDNAHTNLENAFEDCITDELRKELKEIKE